MSVVVAKLRAFTDSRYDRLATKREATAIALMDEAADELEKAKARADKAEADAKQAEQDLRAAGDQALRERAARLKAEGVYEACKQERKLERTARIKAEEALREVNGICADLSATDNLRIIQIFRIVRGALASVSASARHDQDTGQ